MQEAVGCAYEQWDGRGWPGAVKGDDIPIAARLAMIAEFVEVAHRVSGVDAAACWRGSAHASSSTRRWPRFSGPSADSILGGLDSISTWDAVIGSEPSLAVLLDSEQLDRALVAIANFVDLKSPYTLGHTHAVADLVTQAATQLGTSPEDVALLRRAALVSGFGRLGVSNAIWDKRGPLGPGEWERVRMYPYLTERMLHQSATLAPLGAVAVQIRERLDGSGYPRSVAGGAITPPARLLGAADAYQAMREPRPHRESLSAESAATALRDEVRAGHLEGDLVEAVLGAAGHRVRRRFGGPAGLTAREIEVLRLVARGLSNREIAERLVISPKTAGNHIEHIYNKIDASTRATASLYAMQHGLIPEEDFAKAG